jgi:lipopolysaccharide transport system permease protein
MGHAMHSEAVSPGARRTTVYEPPHGWAGLGLHDLWRFRELLYFLAWRDVKVRYKQAALGLGWALLQPVAMMIVATIAFGRVAQLSFGGELPYSVGALAGLVPWTFFVNGAGSAANSVVLDAGLVSKIAFPRITLPVAALLAWVVDLAIGSLLLVGAAAASGTPLSPSLVLLPLLAAYAFLATAGVGLWLSALNVAYRDVRYAVPFLLQLWLFATPVVYPLSVLPDGIRWVAALNPMTGVVDMFRWVFFGLPVAEPAIAAVSALVAGFVLLSGAAYFARVQRFFADVI